MSLFLVMAGGAIGSGLRYVAGHTVLELAGSGYPYGTLTVNLLGGLLMGVLMGALAPSGTAEGWRLFAGVGVLGGFTTFSAFSLDVVQLAERGLSLATGYVLLSVMGSVGALVLGLQLGKAAA